MNLNKTNRLMPLALAACVVLGILIGTYVQLVYNLMFYK